MLKAAPMQNDWMLHVLRDLKSFAELNGMEELAGKLSEAAVLARRSMIEPAVTSHVGQNIHAITVANSN